MGKACEGLPSPEKKEKKSAYRGVLKNGRSKLTVQFIVIVRYSGRNFPPQLPVPL